MEKNDLGSIISDARFEMDKVLSKEKVRPENFTFVYIITGVYKDKNDYWTPLDSVKNYEDFFSKIGIGKNWVSALLLDKQGQYSIYVGTNYINKNPAVLVAYNQELKLIKVSLNENYLAFIRLFNCPDRIFYGIKKDQVDFYKYENEEFVLVKSIY